MTTDSPETTEKKSPIATSLDSYLRGQYKEDTTFLSRLTDTIREVIPIFCSQQTQLPKAKGEKPSVESWPYAVAHKEPYFSWSTHCMILFALDAFSPRGKDRYSILLGKGFRPPKLKLSSSDKDRFQGVVRAAKKALIEVMSHSQGTYLTTSGTYGKDDPFTLTWLAEIFFRWIDCPDVTEDLGKYKDQVVEAVNRALEGNILRIAKKKGLSEVPGSFLEVRRLHLAIAAQRLTSAEKSGAKEWIEKNTPELWGKFDDIINRQLLYSSMGEQKFDPAELAFAFEGELLLHPKWIGRSTVDRVFEALKLSRDRHPFWRPVTPFLANDRGHVLFLISIEVANSILRSCEILHKEGDLNRFSQFEAQLRAYALWLLAEREEVPTPVVDQPTPVADPPNPVANPSNLVGWRSEYETRCDIQLWHTSQVLLFLTHYASLLKRKIAADGVEAAGLQIRPTKPDNEYWKSEPLHSLSGPLNDDSEKTYAVFGRIKKHYIEPRRENKSSDATQPGKDNEAKATPLYSMLLYGPPGTGKTTMAEQIAEELQRPLILITVSDFLAAGAAEIENRAKGVFEILCAQEDVVILFDEIDQFLLDRNSDFYQDQDDIFKFMTPGMLTKLQDLRDAENCIFIVATNYYERIDSAIKRRGRIDEHFLLSLPDEQQRLRILERFVTEVLKQELADAQKKKKYQESAIEEAQKQFIGATFERKFEGEFAAALQKGAGAVKDVLTKTVLFGWGDLKNLVKSKTKFQPGMDINSVLASLQAATGKVDSAVSLSAYQRRFKGDDSLPFEEFFVLLYLLAESNKELSAEEKETIGRVLGRICDFPKKPLNKKLLEGKNIKEEVICLKVNEYLERKGCKAIKLKEVSKK